ncbi:MAG: hypothetical protein H8E22_08095 [Candidatus Cloacimonetes bacterium]|nr:hypothetical protein [Candidatus Cloacimonadota bacterium]
MINPDSSGKKKNFVLGFMLIMSLAMSTSFVWGAEVKITAEGDAGINDLFGFSVGISGDWAIVGARGEGDNGAAYFFKRYGDSWTRKDVEYGIGTGCNYDQFGNSVSICGDYAIVGAPYDEWWTGSHTRETGTAKIFQRVGDSWILFQTLTPYLQDEYMQWYGESVGIDGDRVIVGGPAYSTQHPDPYYFCCGIAYIYHPNGGSYRILNPDPGANYEYFGHSVSISGDYAIVGAYGDNNDTGIAYIFHYDNGNWTQQATLTAGDYASEDDYFGYAVSISGDYAVVGAYNDMAQGSAFIFHRDGELWPRQTRVVADDGYSCDLFGVSVSISGDNLLVGAANEHNDNGYGAGSAYLFKREGENWNQQQKYIAADGESYDDFGYSVSINDNKFIVGAPEFSGGSDNGGYAYIYDLPEAPLPMIDDLAIHYDNVNDLITLTWTYLEDYDYFKIYKSIDPDDFSDAIIDISFSCNYVESQVFIATEPIYFYQVTAVRE